MSNLFELSFDIPTVSLYRCEVVSAVHAFVFVCMFIICIFEWLDIIVFSLEDFTNLAQVRKLV